MINMVMEKTAYFLIPVEGAVSGSLKIFQTILILPVLLMQKLMKL